MGRTTSFLRSADVDHFILFHIEAQRLEERAGTPIIDINLGCDSESDEQTPLY